MIDNVFDSRYGLFGDYFNQEAANECRPRRMVFRPISSVTRTHNRTITPAPPVDGLRRHAR